MEHNLGVIGAGSLQLIFNTTITLGECEMLFSIYHSKVYAHSPRNLQSLIGTYIHVIIDMCIITI
jgi:hypothetical protein